eukprot:TRINITY_DN63355_c0_g1_i1.p1 TRINITY_DN63355_c0_g1~~TRINITY_DN63355_c0_g1_i1.p1  ORF type:complete len:428 (-),score=61.22 TRINITY_DN63355_c0_g1_i1:50-1333(-)
MATCLQTERVMELLQQQLDSQQQMLCTQEATVRLQRSLMEELRRAEDTVTDSKDAKDFSMTEPSSMTDVLRYAAIFAADPKDVGTSGVQRRTDADHATDSEPRDEPASPLELTEAAGGGEPKPEAVRFPWAEAPHQKASVLRMVGRMIRHYPMYFIMPAFMRPLHIDSVLEALGPGRLRANLESWLENQLIVSALLLTISVPAHLSSKPAQTLFDIFFVTVQSHISFANYAWFLLVLGTLVSFQSVADVNLCAWARAAKLPFKVINFMFLCLAWGYGLMILLWSFRLLLDKKGIMHAVFHTLDGDVGILSTLLAISVLLNFVISCTLTPICWFIAGNAAIFSGAYGNQAIPISAPDGQGQVVQLVASALGGMELGKQRLLAYYRFQRDQEDKHLHLQEDKRRTVTRRRNFRSKNHVDVVQYTQRVDI